MNQWQRMVRDAHNKMGAPAPARPGGLELFDPAIREERVARIAEETKEVMIAFYNSKMMNSRKDASIVLLAPLAQELADLIYVCLGTAVAYGIDMQPVFRAVHEANMQKTGIAGGKWQKPPGWVKPDIEKLIRGQVER